MSFRSAAPELAHPAPYAAEPVDVWSAGVLLFALLVGSTFSFPVSSLAPFRSIEPDSFIRLV